MGDIWNPFDTNNPVYVEVAKQTRSTRRRVRAVFLVSGVLGLAYTYRNRNRLPGMMGVKVNQFGVIRRK